MDCVCTFILDPIAAQSNSGVVTISMPRGAKPEGGCEIQGSLQIFALADNKQPSEPRRICLLRVGDPASPEIRKARYLGSIVGYRSSVVWLLYDLGPTQQTDVFKHVTKRG